MPNESKGLKAIRAGNENWTTAKPSIKCDNCGCMRYSACGCVKKVDRGAK